MDGYSISQVAERTGFSPSTLRFYEHEGLVEPARTDAGYRRYDDRDLDALAFVARAKRFGLRLDEIAELLERLDAGPCASVQERLRDLVDARIGEAQHRIGELVTFTAELQRVADGLHAHTPAGPCDDTCGCTTEVQPTQRGPAPSLRRPDDAPSAGPTVACTLAPDRVAGRLAEWQAVVDGAVGREARDGGIRLRLGADVDPGALVGLAAAEQACCPFFTFAVVLDPAGVALDVTGPPDARRVIDAMFGTAA